MALMCKIALALQQYCGTDALCHELRRPLPFKRQHTSLAMPSTHLTWLSADPFPEVHEKAIAFFDIDNTLVRPCHCTHLPSYHLTTQYSSKVSHSKP
jgi:hypothetical protein